ncbi:MAG TPA: CoA transferase, partial [Thermoleophilaceae bacterium]|nr:CoA transferase [Thermoleophilaceae bacterium]
GTEVAAPVANRTRPLAGLRVLEASGFLAGPFAAMTLADLGADVIKVEPPDGDPARTIGERMTEDLSPTFVGGNRGKRSVALDLRSPEGRALVRRLATRSDVVIHNQQVGVAERLGLARAALADENPGVIVGRIAAFGPDGPYADRPALDPVVQAMSGMMSLTGPPGGEPVRTAAPVVDIGAGLSAATAVLAALHARGRTGVGADITISLFETGLMFNSPFFPLRSWLGEELRRRGNMSHAILSDQFAAADGFLTLAVWDEARWTRLCELLGLDALRDRPECADNRSRVRHYEHLRPALADAIAGRRVAELRAALQEAGIPCGITYGLGAVAADEHVRATGALYAERRLVDRELLMVAGPIRIDGERPPSTAPAPRLGEHTRAVLTELLTEPVQHLDELEAAGVIIDRGATVGGPA